MINENSIENFFIEVDDIKIASSEINIFRNEKPIKEKTFHCSIVVWMFKCRKIIRTCHHFLVALNEKISNLVEEV